MGENKGNNSSTKSTHTWVLALEAPSPSRSLVRPQQPRMMKPHVNEKKHEGIHYGILTIDQGQDIKERVLTYFQNNTYSLKNSNGHAQMGMILSATGSILPLEIDTENSSAFDKVSYDITSLGGTYIISEDGKVQEYGPLTISYVGPSGVVVGVQVIGPLVSSGVVQVVVGIFAYNPSEDEVNKLKD